MPDQLPSPGRPVSAAGGELRLPNEPGLIRRFWVRHPWWMDSFIAAAYAVPAVVGSLRIAAFSSTLQGTVGLGATGLVLALASAAAVLFRRRTPLTALVVTVLCAALTFSAQNGFLVVGICLVLYAIAVYRSNRDVWIGLAGAVATLIVGSFLPLPHVLGFNFSSQTVLSHAVVLLLAVLIGVNIGNRKRYLAALIDRAAQLVRERDQRAQLAAASERARIAREMHDIVSHSLTVMVSLADGSAATVRTAPAKSESAMQQVAETGRHALTDMRRMLGVLDNVTAAPGASPAALSPQPTMDDIGALVETFRSAGLPVRWSTSGVPPQDPGQQLTVYRIVQEGLTNALRYAAEATHVTADAVFTAESVTVVIEDDCRVPASRTGGTGRGLLGLQARVALYGGTLQSGPRTNGGWRVFAAFASETGAPAERAGA